VKFWTENKGIGIYPSDWGYAAAFTLTFNDAAKTVTPATLRNFHLFVDCPSLQANFNGGGLSARAAEALRQKFPVLEATLAPKGRVRMTAKGADRLELPRPTAVSWDVQVDIPIYAN
jgi:hypothetical protein